MISHAANCDAHPSSVASRQVRARESAMHGLGRLLHVVDEHGLSGEGGPSARASFCFEGDLHALEGDRLHRGARRPVPAEHAALAVQQGQVGLLVRHAVHEPGQRLIVDLLRVEGPAHRRAQVGEERQLPDPSLELDELLFQLAVRVDDLLGLEIEQFLGVATLVTLAEHVAERDSGEERKGGGGEERPAPAGGRRGQAEENGHGTSDQAGRPEGGSP